MKVETKGQDRYGRKIGDVFLPDGRNLNPEVVKPGFAWWFRRYAPKNRELKRLETQARDARRGLWVYPERVRRHDLQMKLFNRQCHHITQTYGCS